VRLVLADDVPGESEARAFTDFPVKLVIETMKTHRIFGFHCLALDFQYLVERRVILAGQDPAGRAHGFRFKRIAHEAGLKHGGGGNLRDQRRPLRADGKKAELGETIERVPHRLARHAQRLGHLDLGHLGPRRQFQKQNLAVQFVENGVGHRGTIERFQVPQGGRYGHAFTPLTCYAY
jgi:hypothetical protein